jgi:hypothetical protein
MRLPTLLPTLPLPPRLLPLTPLLLRTLLPTPLAMPLRALPPTRVLLLPTLLPRAPTPLRTLRMPLPMPPRKKLRRRSKRLL